LLTVLIAVAAGGLRSAEVAAQAPAEGAVAQRSARIELSPSPLALRCGEAVDLVITVSDVDALWGVDFQLAYDPALLEAVAGGETERGQALSSDVFSRSQAMIALNDVDPVTGVVSFAAALLRPAEPMYGEVELARLRLRGRSAGTGEILLRAVTLADPQAQSIPVTARPVLVEVLCPPASEDVLEGAEEGVEADPAARADGALSEEAVAEEDEQAQMMLYLVIGMLAAVSSVVAGIAGAIAVARRMVPPMPKGEGSSEDETA
jgi:hypothetical protein